MAPKGKTKKKSNGSFYTEYDNLVGYTFWIKGITAYDWVPKYEAPYVLDCKLYDEADCDVTEFELPVNWYTMKLQVRKLLDKNLDAPTQMLTADSVYISVYQMVDGGLVKQYIPSLKTVAYCLPRGTV
jgi:hypothetical protein